MSELSCYFMYGGDYRMPETRSALLWDLLSNQLTGAEGGEGGRMEGRKFLDGSRISVSSFG